MDKDIQQQLDELKKEVSELKSRRIRQEMILPGAVKQRHIGEGTRYIRSGLAADRPTSGEEPLQGSAFYFATDTGVLSGWDGSAWLDVTLS